MRKLDVDVLHGHVSLLAGGLIRIRFTLTRVGRWGRRWTQRCFFARVTSRVSAQRVNLDTMRLLSRVMVASVSNSGF